MLSIFIAIIILPILVLGSIFLWTPANVRFPKFDHSHFRMQYIFQGQPEDFGSPRYQVEYSKDSCTGEIPNAPLHFHDQRDHFVHNHWQKVTGAQVLKYYGLNKIDIIDQYMGIRFDDLLQYKWTPVPIHSNSLPKPKDGDKFFIYTGKKGDFKKRDFQQFLSQDLEQFFGVDSSIRKTLEEDQKSKKINFLELNAIAHNGVEHSNQTEAQKHELEVKEEAKLKAEVEARNNQSQLPKTATPVVNTDEELKDINNLLGDVIIFVQKEEPTEAQINSRFDAMVPLSPSTCGG